jgi:hypothetical protein
MELTLTFIRRTEGARSTEAVQRKAQTQLVDIPSAAYRAGYSVRDFRRIIKEDHIPVVKIGRKEFITASALELWNSTRREARLDECIKRLDRWFEEDARRSPEPLPSFDDIE